MPFANGSPAMAAWAWGRSISPDPNYSRSIENADKIFSPAEDGAVIMLGINAYHADAAACILRDGVLVAAAEEERFRRLKHWAGFPSRAIAYCLQEAKIDLGDVATVAVNRSGRANFFRKLAYVLTRRPSPQLIAKRLRNRKQVKGIAAELGALPGRRFAGAIDYVEHHVAHLASAFYPSPFAEAAVA